MMRTITFGTRRTTAIQEPRRSIDFVRSERTVVVSDVERTVTFTRPSRRLTVNRISRPPSAFVRPVRTFTVIQGRAGRDGHDGAGAELVGPFTAGELLTSSSLTHLSLADGKIYLADYELDRPANCFTISGFAEGATLSVYRSGLLNGLGGIDPGREYWLGNAGQLRTTCPDHGVTQRCGTGASATELMVSLFEDIDWE